MAGVSRVPAAHRSAAERLNGKKPDLVKRMPQGELNARSAYVTKLSNDADGMDSEAGNEVRSHASRVLNSLPITEYHRTLADLDRSAYGAPGDPMSPGLDARSAYRARMSQVRSDNAFPPDLAHAVEAELAHGVPPEQIDVDRITGWAEPVSKGTVRTDMRTMVAREMLAQRVELDKRIAQLRKDIADYKASQERKRDLERHIRMEA